MSTFSGGITIQATIGYIEGQWARMGYHSSHECYDAVGDQATNLIVEQSGSKRADEILLLGAHYDTVYTTPGADDNASAVAVLLEVSRLLREHQCKRSIRYVAFAYEEPLVRGEKLKWLRLFKVCSLVTGCVWLADECQLAHAASFFKVDLV